MAPDFDPKKTHRRFDGGLFWQSDKLIDHGPDPTVGRQCRHQPFRRTIYRPSAAADDWTL